MTSLDQFSATGTGRLVTWFMNQLDAAEHRRAQADDEARFQSMADSDHRVRADLQAARDRQDVSDDVVVVAAATPARPLRPLNEGLGAWLRRYPVAYA